MQKPVELSTGLPQLDLVFQGVRPGDSLVWRIDSVKDYLPFVRPYCEYAREHGQKLLYFRFAEHAPLVEEDDDREIHILRPERGFDPFIEQLHQIIAAAPSGTFYLFDCLSGLAAKWQSDRMLGNFFVLASSYIKGLTAVAYFSLFRDYHSLHALDPIIAGADLLINVYCHQGALYIHPMKAAERHSSTIYTLHRFEGEQFIPVTQSGVITEILSGIQWSRLGASAYKLGYWSETFAEAERIQSSLSLGMESEAIGRVFFHKLLHMLISHDDKVLRLAQQYFTVGDLLDIRRRMIGTGRIGGKSVGMLLARVILRESDARWEDILEVHDSFYVGSDIFYTYLVSNGYWWMVKKNTAALLDSATSSNIRQQLLGGSFPDSVVKQFSDMLDYFGQAPIIVRSSSLLEDAFGNAFAGKYESVFLANQGTHEERLGQFLAAVRTIYASIVSEEALHYRLQRKLLDREEQMALLIQRVSGSSYGHYHYPQAAGVGFSFNPYVWHKDIDPEAGMLRIVFGLGTRAVDRNDDDYSRIVALNAPTIRQEESFDKVRQHAQRQVDVLDLEQNKLLTRSFVEVAADKPELPLEFFASEDKRLKSRLGRKLGPKFGRKLDLSVFPWVLTFDKLISETDFIDNIRKMLSVLSEAYHYPVDIEFTVNFFDRERYRINLVQCRPLQVWGAGMSTSLPDDIAEQCVFLRSEGPVIGRSREVNLDWLIMVVPEVYARLPMRERHGVARTIGQLTNDERIKAGTIMLLGPGRWGTTSPELGVPVSFAEIHNVAVLCEVVTMHEKLIPDFSLGTHFFNELVENDMLYLALFPEAERSVLRTEFFAEVFSGTLSSKLALMFPEESGREEVVRLFNLGELPAESSLSLNADTISQRVVCYLRSG